MKGLKILPLQEHASMAVQYFVGNNAETALYFLLVILKVLSNFHEVLTYTN